MADPPRVRSSCTVPSETWTRLPDDGFEILHFCPGNQAIGAQPLTVQIRRLGPVLSGGEPTAPKFRPEESAERQCSYCEATDRVLAVARLLDEFAMSRLADDADVSGKLFDALVKVAEMVAKRNPLGRKLAMTILGVEQ